MPDDQPPQIVSVITAVDPERAEHLPDVWASLVAQELPDSEEVAVAAERFERITWQSRWSQPPQTRRELLGPPPVTTWTFEWLVQCDSLDPDAQAAVHELLPEDPRVSFGASRHGGPGIARTMALARVRGQLVKVLDADDQLAPGVLARDIAACSTPGIGWSVSHVIDVHPDGTHTEHRDDLPHDGHLKGGALGIYWRQHGWNGIWAHPATLCARRSLVLALGGWMALPASEDTGLLLALDAVRDGWFHDTVGMYYRRWAPQMSASAAHVDDEERAARRTLITQRLDALPGLLRA